MPLVTPSSLIPVFSNPELATTAEILYAEAFDPSGIELARGLWLEKPLKPVRGSTATDPKIFLGSLTMNTTLLKNDASNLGLAYHVFRTQAQIIRNNIQNQNDEFLLTYDPMGRYGESSIRFRSPRFADRIPSSHVIAFLSNFEEMTEATFENAYAQTVAHYTRVAMNPET